jgi:hypothetical protein
MPPSPIPAPLPPWARAILNYGPIIGGFLWGLLDHEASVPETKEWRRCVCHVQNLATGAVAADDAYVSFDLANITGGDVDSTWSTADYTTCEGLLDTFWTAAKTNMMAYGKLVEYRWYSRWFNPVTESKPFANSGPPQRVTVKSIVGSDVSNGPSQMSMTVTEKTAWPKHWGRIYMPFYGPNFYVGNHYTNTGVDTLCGLVNTLYGGLMSAEFFPCVPVTQVDKDPARALLTVNKVVVDNVPDVVRRRRPRSTTYRKTLP